MHGNDKNPIEIINGHIDIRDAFDHLLEKQCLPNYINKHNVDMNAKTNERHIQDK